MGSNPTHRVLLRKIGPRNPRQCPTRIEIQGDKKKTLFTNGGKHCQRHSGEETRTWVKSRLGHSMFGGLLHLTYVNTGSPFLRFSQRLHPTEALARGFAFSAPKRAMRGFFPPPGSALFLWSPMDRPRQARRNQIGSHQIHSAMAFIHSF